MGQRKEITDLLPSSNPLAREVSRTPPRRPFFVDELTTMPSR